MIIESFNHRINVTKQKIDLKFAWNRGLIMIFCPKKTHQHYEEKNSQRICL